MKVSFTHHNANKRYDRCFSPTFQLLLKRRDSVLGFSKVSIASLVYDDFKSLFNFTVWRLSACSSK